MKGTPLRQLLTQCFFAASADFFAERFALDFLRKLDSLQLAHSTSRHLANLADIFPREEFFWGTGFGAICGGMVAVLFIRMCQEAKDAKKRGREKKSATETSLHPCPRTR